MYHSLNTNLATRIGVTPALIAQVLWDETTANHSWAKVTYHKGRFYLKAGYKTLHTVMPYLTYHQIKRAVGTLVDLGILLKVSRITSNLFDSTNFYCFSDAGELLMKTSEQSMYVIEGDDDE